MKKILLLTVFVLLTITLFCGELNKDAKWIIEKDNETYQNTIRKHAIECWDDDHVMIIWSINNQCSAFFNLCNIKKIDYKILTSLIFKWSHAGYEEINIKILKSKSTAILPLLELHADWQMVYREYIQQIEAKEKY